MRIGLLCGASFINEKFEAKLLKKLKDESYLITNGKTLKSIAQAKTTLFENYQKRIIDVTKNNVKIPVYIDNLRENTRKQFYRNNLELNRCVCLRA
jgi:hypothetical protein